MEFVLKTRANSSASQYVASSQRSSPQAISNGFPSVSSVYFVVIPVSLLPTGALPQLFPTVSLPSTLSSLPYRSFPPELSPSYFPSFSSMHPVVIPVSLLRSFPTELSPSYFPRFPLRPHYRRFHISLLPKGAHPKLFPTVSLPSTLSSLPYIAPSHRNFASASLLPNGALPKLYFPRFPPSTLLSLPYRSFPTELSQSYFPRFPFPPPCRHSRIAPSHRGALPKLFPTVSLPSTLSSLPYRSFPPELSPSYFPRLPFRPPCRHSRIAPPHRSSPQAISHGFPSVHPIVTPVSLLPTGTLPQLFPTVSLPSTLSSLPHRSFPPELSPSYFPRFPLRPPNRCFHPFPPNGDLPKLFSTVSPPSTLSSNPYRSLAANVTKREPKHRRCFWEKKNYQYYQLQIVTVHNMGKSAHTALAVKACSLGGKTATLNAQ